MCDFNPDADNGVEFSDVVQMFKSVVTEILDLEFIASYGQIFTITTTPEHPFYVPEIQDYICAINLPLGVELTNEIILISKEYRNDKMEVYNFEVKVAVLDKIEKCLS